MTHFKSTLATAAVALTGLVIAQQVFYPRIDEPRRPRVVVAETAEVVAASAPVWADPPAKVQAQAKAADPKPEEAQASAAEAAPPAQAVPIPPTRHVALTADGAKKAESAKRRKLAQNAARNRQVASRTGAAGETDAATASTAPAAPQPRVDPIGDLLKGLGIGGQG